MAMARPNATSQSQMHPLKGYAAQFVIDLFSALSHPLFRSRQGLALSPTGFP
jgi:hypothetical protein